MGAHRLGLDAGRSHPLGRRHLEPGAAASRPPPLGYGRERYFWSFIVAIVLFTGGAVFALVEGEEKLRHPHS
jgi:hypothetical protein